MMGMQKYRPDPETELAENVDTQPHLTEGSYVDMEFADKDLIPGSDL